MNRKRILHGIIVLNCLCTLAFANTKLVMSTVELLHLAEVNSQSITAAEFNVLVRQKEIDIAKARLYPVFNAEGLDSTGFPGSSAWLGIEGLVSSPYRAGATGGVVARQLLLDF